MPARLAPTGTKPHSRRIDGSARMWPGASRLVVVADAGVAYNDVGTVVITLSGTGVESYAVSEARTATVTLSGTVPNESNIHIGVSDNQDAASIEFTLIGTKTGSAQHTGATTAILTMIGAAATGYTASYADDAYGLGVEDSHSHDGSGTGPITLSGTSVASHTVSEAGTAVMTFTGSIIGSASHSGATTATLTLTGTATESYQQGGVVEYNDAGICTLVLSGTRTGAHTHTASRTVTLVLSGTGSAPNTDSETLEELLVGWIATAVTGYPAAATTGRMRGPRTGSLA